MNPGETISPSASTVRSAADRMRPISTMRPARTPTSPRKRAAPEPSTIVPPRISRSRAIARRLRAHHGVTALLHFSDLARNEPLVEGRRHRRISGPRQHGRQPAALELLDRPLEGIGHERLVQVDPLVLVAGAVVVVRVDAEAVEGQELDLLAGNVAHDVDRDPAIALAGGTHLEAEPDVTRLDDVRPAVVPNGASLGDRHLGRLGLQLVERRHQERWVDLQPDLLVARMAEHRRQLLALLGHRLAQRLAGHRRIEHDADVLVLRVVVIVRMIVEALEPEQFALLAVHVVNDLQAYALVRVAPPVAARVGGAAVDVAVLQGKADRSTCDLRATDVHRASSPLGFSEKRVP